jgi:hypothetical protein
MDRSILSKQTPFIWLQVNEILTWLALGYAPVYARPSRSFSAAKVANDPSQMPQPSAYVEIDKEMLARLTTLLTFRFKQLAKVLPDMRAVEVNDISASFDPTTADLPGLSRKVRGLLALELAQHATPAQGERLQ